MHERKSKNFFHRSKFNFSTFVRKVFRVLPSDVDKTKASETKAKKTSIFCEFGMISQPSDNSLGIITSCGPLRLPWRAQYIKWFLIASPT